MTSAKFKIKSFIALAALALVIAAVIGFGSVGTSAARTTSYASSPMGLAFGERASLNYANLTERPAEFEMVFLDANGRVLKASRGLLLPYRSVALEISFRELGSSANRAHVRAVMRTSGTPQGGTASAEIFDEQSGKTSFGLLLPAMVGFDPQPDPPSQP